MALRSLLAPQNPKSSNSKSNSRAQILSLLLGHFGLVYDPRGKKKDAWTTTRRLLPHCLQGILHYFWCWGELLADSMKTCIWEDCPKILERVTHRNRTQTTLFFLLLAQPSVKIQYFVKIVFSFKHWWIK